MISIPRLIRSLWITGWYSFAIFVVISAVGLSSARYLLPLVKDYNKEIETQISELIGQPIEIGGLDAEWHGFGPKLVLQKVALLDEKNGSAIANFEKAFLGFDLFSFIFHGQLGLNHISVSGVNLYVERNIDGSIAIGGVKKNDSESVVSNRNLEDWVLGQVRLNISNTSIYWHDRKLGSKPVHFSNVDITLKNDGERHQLRGTVNLPDTLGEKLIVAIDVHGNPLHTDKNREGIFYVKGIAIKPSKLLADNSIDNFKIKSLTADFELWSTWKKGKLVKITGDIDANSIHLINTAATHKKNEIKLQKISGQSVWQRTNDERNGGWDLNIQNFILERNGSSWPPTNISLRSDSLRPDSGSALQAKLDFLRIEDIIYLALFANGSDSVNTSAIRKQSPTGELRDIFINYIGSDKNNPDIDESSVNKSVAGKPIPKKPKSNKPKFNFEANFNGITFSPQDTLPGIRNLSGSIATNSNSGSLALNSQNATLFMPELFRVPIPIDKLIAVLDWSQTDSSWRLSSRNIDIKNEDLDASIKLKLDIPINGSSPFLSLAASFKDGHGSNISRYVPYKIMPKIAIDWIDRSLKGGEILSGNTVFHGRFADFPFKKREGKFELYADTRNVTIDYAPQWPSLKKINMELEFLNQGLTVTGHSGKILTSDIFAVEARIKDLAGHPAIANIIGKIKGPTQDKLDFLRIVPELKKNFEDSLTEVSMNGQSLLQLDLSIPLSKNPRYETKTKGNITLVDNSINIRGALGQIWSNLDGRIYFTENDLTANNLTGLFFNSPAKLDILTTKYKKNTLTRFKTKGTLRPESAMQRLIPSWKKYFQGDTKWAVNLDIPHSANTTIAKPVVRIKTQLDNIEIDMPKPFNKKAGEKINLEVNVELSKSTRTFEIQYGKSINSNLEFTVNNEKLSLSKGTVTINSIEKNKLPTSGISVMAKNIKHFSYDDWLSVFENTPELNANDTNNKANPLTWFSRFKTSFGELRAFDQTYHSVTFDAVKIGDNWESVVSSDELSGKIILPVDLTSAPISMKLDTLMLFPKDEKKIESYQAEKPDPRNWPAMIINSKRFVLDDTEYGSLLLSISKLDSGLQMDYLELTTSTNKISGNGSWTTDGLKHTTQVKLKSEINNIGATMASMGFADTINKGEGTFLMDINWPDAPSEVNAGIISGTINLNFKNGQLLDINPGAGRIFGLLSLQSLPRRLLLDFSDIFAEGFSFDEIKGKFDLDGGDAYTSDLHLDGPAGRIQVSGRTGLVDEDYDQLVTVIPDAAASVPVLTVLAGAEPITAIVTWTLKNVFQSQIDEALSFQYTITGSWDNPKVVKVGQPQSPQPEPLEEDDEP